MVQQPRLRFSGSGIPKSHNVIGHLLLLIVVHCLFTPVQSVNGVIWDKKKNDFVPIVSNPIFAAMNQEFLSRSREDETYNFQGRAFKFSYYEINDVIHTVRNGTSVSGYIGDTWNILAEYLNLTLKPDRSNTTTLGFLINDTFTPGLLRTISLNQTDIIARVEMMGWRLAAAQFTFPLRSSRHNYLVKPKRQHVTNWMLKLYSRKVWFAILVTYIILSVCSYVFQVIEAGMFEKNRFPGMIDYFFYNLGMICIQNCNTSSARRCSRFIEYLVGLFALLISATFNAVVFGYLSQVVSTAPFYNYVSLLENTKYNVMAVNGSTYHELFEGKTLPDHTSKSDKKRVFLVSNLTEMYMRLCSDELVTTFISDELGKSINYPCTLQSVGTSVVVGISSAISWQFQHKRSIDIALIKLYENGILHAIHRQWLKCWQKDINSGIPEAVVMEQVHFIYMVLLGGLFMSLIVLVLEQITFHCNK